MTRAAWAGGLLLLIEFGGSALAHDASPTPQAFVQQLHAGWYAPRAREFATRAAHLAEATQAYCAADGPLAAPREAWRDGLLAWARLGSVAIGPLVERRALRRIDFGPTRPELLARAIDSHPAGEADMEQIGSAAKGLPALERLLFAVPARPGADDCRYAVELAADIAHEADAQVEAFDPANADTPDDEQAAAAFSEMLNQWVGAVEALRDQGMLRPLHQRQTRGSATLQLARDASGASVAEREARWQTLRALVVPERGAPAAADAALPTLTSQLRGLGQGRMADRLGGAVRRAEVALAAAHDNAPARLQAAARRLAELKALVEAEVAPALGVHIGFSSADGD